MNRKIAALTLFLGLAGLLVAGGIIRTQEKISQAGVTPTRAQPPDRIHTIVGSLLAPADDGDLALIADDGSRWSVGVGPGYLAGAGLALQAGDRVQVVGYWEDEEFKVSSITRLSDGQVVTLRDETGRPAWAGGGRGAGRQR